MKTRKLGELLPAIDSNDFVVESELRVGGNVVRFNLFHDGLAPFRIRFFGFSLAYVSELQIRALSISLACEFLEAGANLCRWRG